MSLGTAGSARGHRSGRSAAWLARLVRDQEVDGSNPFAPTTFISLYEFELRDIKLRLRFLHFVSHVAQLGPASTWVGRNRGRLSRHIPSVSCLILEDVSHC